MAKRHVHSFPFPRTFVVKRFERNSRTKFVPNRPARPMAELGEDQVRSPIRLGIVQIGQCSCAHVAK